VRLLAVTLALAGAAFAGVTVTSPTVNSTNGSPVQFVASATSSHPITGMHIYVDSVDVYHTIAGSLTTSVAVGVGSHTAVVRAWDSTGAILQQTVTFKVSSSAPTPTPTPSASPSPTPSGGLPTPPSNAIVEGDIDQMPGWQNCTVCAGANASGPTAKYSMAQNVLSPSLDSKSAQFNISGTTPYSDVLWWKQLGGNNAIRNFKYDVSFFLTNPQLPQALEFDVNQSDSVHKFIFGTQCDIKGAGMWEVWGNAAGNWMSTGIPCSAPAALTWHHLTWEFQRTDTNVIFVGFTYDGVTHYVNKSYPAIANGVNEINVAFQMDGDSHMDAFSTWLDKLSLTYW
jgi:hypothetical protein